MSTDESTDDGRTDYNPTFEHREGLEDIADSDDPDDYVARILLALADGRDPHPSDLKRLRGPESGGFEQVTTPSGSRGGDLRDQLKQAAPRVLRKARRRERE